MSDTIEERCQWRRCRSESMLIYFGIGLCPKHWIYACEVSLGHGVETRILVYHKVNKSAQPIMKQTYNDREAG